MRMQSPIMATPVKLVKPKCLPSQFPNVPEAIVTDPRNKIPVSFWILHRTCSCSQTGLAVKSINSEMKSRDFGLVSLFNTASLIAFLSDIFSFFLRQIVESGLWSDDVIGRQLSHSEHNNVRAATLLSTWMNVV